MSLITNLKRLEYANYLIKKKATCSLESFSQKMRLSERAIKELISEMRELGANINLDRKRKTYFYAENGELCISKFICYGKILTREDASKIGKPEELCFSEKSVFIPCKDF